MHKLQTLYTRHATNTLIAPDPKSIIHLLTTQLIPSK